MPAVLLGRQALLAREGFTAILQRLARFKSGHGHMTKSGPETRLVGRIVLAIKNRWPSAWVTKIHGGSYQTAGIPDLLVVVNGRLVAIEVKAKKPGESADHARNRATPTQRSTIAAIERAGGIAGVVLSTEEACDLVSSALHPKAGDTPERGTLT